MRFEDTLEVQSVDGMSMSSSSMSGYDMDVEDLEIELRRERLRMVNYPHIIVGSHSWEQDERLDKYCSRHSFQAQLHGTII